MKNTITINTDLIICDACNKDFTKSDDEGGIIDGDWAICPKCEMKWNRRLKAVKCPEKTSFKNFVLNYRKNAGWDYQ